MKHVSEKDFARIMTKLEAFLDAVVTLDTSPISIDEVKKFSTTMGFNTSDSGSPDANKNTQIY